jgi:hypothetical protein
MPNWGSLHDTQLKINRLRSLSQVSALVLHHSRSIDPRRYLLAITHHQSEPQGTSQPCFRKRLVMVSCFHLTYEISLAYEASVCTLNVIMFKLCWVCLKIWALLGLTEAQRESNSSMCRPSKGVIATRPPQKSF